MHDHPSIKFGHNYLLNLFFIFQPCLAAHFHDNRRNNQQRDAVCTSCGQTEHRRRSHK
ncbi:uncharacterized protein BYT42DRAFT_573954, partial [Radiomyces spectabilis]|uniref:uncharacterized protein n=1 Tax=Radiomyces spectabilis TaxID=64574 RepID=UPI00221EB8DB